MAKLIIPFLPRYRREEARITRRKRLVDAAWQLTHCALWPEQPVHPIAQQWVTGYLTFYLYAAVNKKRAFQAFVQRILLTRGYL